MTESVAEFNRGIRMGERGLNFAGESEKAVGQTLNVRDATGV